MDGMVPSMGCEYTPMVTLNLYPALFTRMMPSRAFYILANANLFISYQGASATCLLYLLISASCQSLIALLF